MIRLGTLARSVWAALTACLLLAPASPAVEGSAFIPETRSPRGIVVSDQPLASQAGVDVMREGGNALDAAVTAVFALGVVQPGQCGIGGSARILYRPAHGTTVMIDGGAVSPLAATPTTISHDPERLDAVGLGHRVVAVPGAVSGLDLALREHGTISLARAVQAAEQLAREGFEMTGDLFGQIAFGGGQEILSTFPHTASIYLHPSGRAFFPGELLIQSDLAWTLRRLGEHGARDFYDGEIARRLVAEMAKPPVAAGDEAIMTAEDLARLEAVRRKPVRGSYRGATVESAPPPAAGVIVVEALNILSGFNLKRMGEGSADARHVIAEALKLAEADAGAVLTDPAFYPVPIRRLTSPAFANERRQKIDMAAAKVHQPGVETGRPRGRMKPRDEVARGHTSHLTAIDRRGNAAAITCTISASFGSGVVAEGTGVLLNNSMRGSSQVPAGHPDQMEGGKSVASAVSPTIVSKGGEPLIGVGAAGDASIYRNVVGIVTNILDFDMDIAHAVDAERYHAYQDEAGPYAIAEDERIPFDVLDSLAGRGHQLFAGFGEYACCPPALGIASAAGIDPRTGERRGSADPRRLEENAAIGQ